MNIPIVSDINKKSEILEAYNQAKELLLERKDTTSAPFRTQIISEVEKIENILKEKKIEAELLEKDIVDLKAKLDLGKNLKLTKDNLEELKNYIEQEQLGWDRKKSQLKIELEEEKKWQEQRLKVELEQNRWKFENEIKQKQVALEEKENGLKSIQSENLELKKQIEKFSNTLEIEIKKTIQETTENLKKDFEIQMQLISQGNKSQENLLQQTIANLENRIKEQKLENDNLRKELITARNQIEQLAVAALKFRSDATERTETKERT